MLKGALHVAKSTNDLLDNKSVKTHFPLITELRGGILLHIFKLIGYVIHLLFVFYLNKGQIYCESFTKCEFGTLGSVFGRVIFRAIFSLG